MSYVHLANPLHVGSSPILASKESPQVADEASSDAPAAAAASAAAFAAATEPVDVVEVALVDALTMAAPAGRFDVVAQLAKELEASLSERP